jgi:hypothetical protein
MSMNCIAAGEGSGANTSSNKEDKYMTRYLGWFFSAVVMLAVNAPLQALNYEVGGCKTGSGYVNFTTISAAVAGVPAGATIQVCPGVYPEQVTITQPLTLKGIASGNANRAVITYPRGNLVPNVTSIFNGQAFYAQVLVQNVSPAGAVSIVGITVDGSGINLGSPPYVAGIFYASGTSGTVNEVTARNQMNGGFGVWVENGSSTSDTLTIENNSVHNQGVGGIWANAATSSTLTATVSGNFLSNLSSNGGSNEILIVANGEISGNFVTSSPYPTGFAIFAEGSVGISGNSVADVYEGIGPASATSVKSNKLSNVGSGIYQFGSVPFTSNTIKNAVCAIDFYGGASSSGPISGNVINDSQYGFAEWSGPTITGNSLYNIDTIQTTSDGCP